MAGCGRHRKERVHMTGSSNRTAEWVPGDGGPLDFDANMRSTLPTKMTFTQDLHVPANPSGSGNRDFNQKLSGHDFRQPNSDPQATRRTLKATKARESEELQRTQERGVPTITIPAMIGKEEKDREQRQKGFKQKPRHNPRTWHEAPTYMRAPLQREEGETWNSRESSQMQGDLKGKDRLHRSVRRPEDVATPQSDTGGGKHPLHFDTEEYYPGRDLIDAVSEDPGNDFQVRPTHLPDFHNPPPENGDHVGRMQRIREVLRQRYAGRPGLVNVFRKCALTKSGYVFPKDLMQVLDQMGIKAAELECEMLVRAVDKDQKGAVTFEEFSDLIYGSKVHVGGPPHEPQERHVRHITKTLVDSLITNGQVLGKAFCEIDPERHFVIGKQQFSNALGTACNHISKQAIDYLWASQFSPEQTQVEERCIDWRNFMSQLAHFAHDNRAPTPCCVQSRKRQYDLLMRTAAITGGQLSDVDLCRPEQNAEDEVHIVGDKLVHRHNELLHKPRDAAFLTEPFVEGLRVKASRVERALPRRLKEGRLRELLKNRKEVHQDELINLLCTELEDPNQQPVLPPQEPLYTSHPSVEASLQGGAARGKAPADVMTLDPQSLEAVTLAAGAAEGGGGGREGGGPAVPGGDGGGTSAFSPQASHERQQPTPACLQLVRADIEAYVVTQQHNRDHEVDVDKLLKNIYMPPAERRAIDTVNDGLNRQIRGNRPQRERPAKEEEVRYDNYWQARYIMEAVNDAIANVENSNGGKIKPSKLFKRLDADNDGFISLSDLRAACAKYKVPNTSADLHAMLTALDKDDKGSVDIGEFTRNFEVHQGTLLDCMQKPIKHVYHEGGVKHGGPVEDAAEAKEAEILGTFAAGAGGDGGGGTSPSEQKRGQRALRSQSEPPASGGGGARSSKAASDRSNMSRTGQSLIYESQVARMMTKGRISDVIRSRVNTWKPGKADLYTAIAPTRHGMTMYPDTRHVTEANVPLSHSYLGESERFKTTNNVHSIFSSPDHTVPQHEDAMKKHARNEFRVERIRNRQQEFAERCEAAEEATKRFDDLKIARRAMTQLNYERRCNMACG